MILAFSAIGALLFLLIATKQHRQDIKAGELDAYFEAGRKVGRQEVVDEALHLINEPAHVELKRESM